VTQELFLASDSEGVITSIYGRWANGSPWERFGLYNYYLVLSEDGRASTFPAHAGELVPGSTEDIVASTQRMSDSASPSVPMTVELDVTNRCASRDCGGSCFSSAYRRTSPKATISSDCISAIIEDFADQGGRILRFDGGGDPLLHPDIRSGRFPLLAHSLGLKTTILTSGDFLDNSELPALSESRCYVRISLNASTDKTRMIFHGNKISLSTILSSIEQLANFNSNYADPVPIGATFLITEHNFRELASCAARAREAGVGHFSARRVLGPSSIRPRLTTHDKQQINQLLEEISWMDSPEFRVSVPWRDMDEADINPSRGDFSADRCWQSTLKAVLESSHEQGHCRVQLCGRYRGNGLGQLMTLPPLISSTNGLNWVSEWRKSFTSYPIKRKDLLNHCTSCIDRGFILMTDRLMKFISQNKKRYVIFHYKCNQDSNHRLWNNIQFLNNSPHPVNYQTFFDENDVELKEKHLPLPIRSWDFS
jgi:MoaA/NifB/PqqE/SkfB family radical SAM enzyme